MTVHVSALLLPWEQNRDDQACSAQAGRALAVTQTVCIAVLLRLCIWWLVPCQYKVRIAEKKSRSGKTSIGRSIIPLSLFMDVSKESNDGNSTTSWDNPFHPVTTLTFINTCESESFFLQFCPAVFYLAFVPNEFNHAFSSSCHFEF